MPKDSARSRGVFASVRARMRFAEVAIVLVSIGVAAVGASSLVTLQHEADEARRAELLVARVGETASNLHDRSRRATDVEIDRQVRSLVDRDKARTRKLLAELEALDPDGASVDPVRTAHRRFLAEIDRALGAAGDRERARSHQLVEVLPLFTSLQLELETAGEHYDEKAVAAVRNAAIGSVLAVVLAALFVGLLGLAFARRQAARDRAALDERTALLGLLEAVSASSNAAQTLEEAMCSTLAEISAHTGWPIGHAYLLSEDGSGELVPAGLWHVQGRRERFEPFIAETASRRFGSGEGLPGRVLAERRPVWVTDVAALDSSMPRAPVATGVGIRSAFAFPVFVEDDVVAVLEFFSQNERAPERPLLETTGHIGFQLGFLLQRKRAESELRATEARYRTLVEQLPLATYIDEPEGLGTTTYLSPQIEALSGFPPEAYLTDPELFQKILHPDDRERVLGAILDATAKGAPVEQEYRIVARDGQVRWWRDAAVVVRDEAGKASYRQGYVVDLTARREAEERLRDAEERYRALVEQLPLVTYIDKADATCTSIYISPQVETTLGYPRESWADSDFFPSILHPEDREWVLAEHVRAYTAQVGLTLEYRLMHRDGHPVWFRDQMTVVRDERGEAVYAQGYMLDITERRASEERLQEAEKRYRTLVEQLPLAVYIDALDESSSAIYMSPQIESMLGYSVEEWLTDKELFPKLLHTDDRERVMAEVDRTRVTGDPFQCEYRLVARDGRPVWIRDEDVTIRDEAGNLLYSQGYMLDITARKEVEEALERSLDRERSANVHLRELDRLKDEFIALVSHELRTPLTSIRGYLEFLLEEADQLPPDHARFLAIVERNAERLQHLVNDLLFVAQVDAGRLSIQQDAVDLSALAGEAVEAARVVAAAKEIELGLVSEWSGTFVADRARLAQLLDNFISNAIKFTPEGGRVDVRTWTDDARAHVSIADSGIGIPEGEQERLFERFYRASSATEKAIPGTGLGLAIAKAIVDAHGGSISVESEVGVGTTFRVSLPLVAELDDERRAA